MVRVRSVAIARDGRMSAALAWELLQTTWDSQEADSLITEACGIAITT
jgi:hypothetical protein